ncbi:MAG: hypothetical protein FWE46_04775 [Coriobacteriia bacterium]|nr:hypothetical protein [Coriobacteriia bacterium]MCL2537610.1 hypothetical protein [Coriobacteriia bacterium]
MKKKLALAAVAGLAFAFFKKRGGKNKDDAVETPEPRDGIVKRIITKKDV